MAPDNKKSKAYTYTLCRVCNSKGVKGSPMVICIKCKKHVHTKNICAIIFDATNMQYMCLLCKIVRRSIQSDTINPRRSAHRVSTPLTTISYTSSRRNTGRDSKTHTTVQPAPQTTVSATDQPGNMELTKLLKNLEAQLEKMKNSVQDLEIKCANNNTAILFLKQDNQRLSNLLTNYHTDIHDTSTSLGILHYPSNTVSSNDQRINNNFNQIDHTILNNNNSNLNLHDKNNFLHNNNCNNKLSTLVHTNAIINISNHCDITNLSNIDSSDNNTSHNNFKINIDNGTKTSHKKFCAYKLCFPC